MLDKGTIFLIVAVIGAAMFAGMAILTAWMGRDVLNLIRHVSAA